MSFFIEPGDKGTIKPGSILRALTDPENIVRANPEYADRFSAIAELRAQDDGSFHRGQEFRRVASLCVPAFMAHAILNGEFLRDRKLFYQWLDSEQGEAYCTYDRRKNAKRSDMVTFVNGKEI